MIPKKILIVFCALLLSPSLCFGALSLSFVSSVPFVSTESIESPHITISGLGSSSLVSVSANVQETPLVLDMSNLSNLAEATQNIELKVSGQLLNYPNPFSFSSGQTEIGYRLTKEAYLTLKIYTLTGQMVYSLEISPTDYGRARYNKIPLSRAILGGTWLPPGVYLYLLINDGHVLAKNRMVIVP